MLGIWDGALLEDEDGDNEEGELGEFVGEVVEELGAAVDDLGDVLEVGEEEEGAEDDGDVEDEDNGALVIEDELGGDCAAARILVVVIKWEEIRPKLKRTAEREAIITRDKIRERLLIVTLLLSLTLLLSSISLSVTYYSPSSPIVSKRQYLFLSEYVIYNVNCFIQKIKIFKFDGSLIQNIILIVGYLNKFHFFRHNGQK